MSFWSPIVTCPACKSHLTIKKNVFFINILLHLSMLPVFLLFKNYVGNFFGVSSLVVIVFVSLAFTYSAGYEIK